MGERNLTREDQAQDFPSLPDQSLLEANLGGPASSCNLVDSVFGIACAAHINAQRLYVISVWFRGARLRVARD